MKKEEFAQLLGDIEESYVLEGTQRPQRVERLSLRWAVAACLCLVAGGLFLLGKGPWVEPDNLPSAAPSFSQQPGEVREENQLVINWTDEVTMLCYDMDVKLEQYPEWDERAEEAFSTFLGQSWETLLGDLPEEWNFSGMTGILSPGGQGEYVPHDLVITLKNGADGEVTLALCSREKPLRDMYYLCDDPVRSTVNGVELVVRGVNDRLMVDAFAYEGCYYDVSTQGIGGEELAELLTGLLT